MRWTWVASQTSSKPGQIASFVKSYAPLIVVKAFIYHQHNSFSFDWIILELADKVDMGEVLDEFEKRPDLIVYLRVTTP